MEEMTKDEWINKAMVLLSTLAVYYPIHYETSDGIFKRVYNLQNARFKED